MPSIIALGCLLAKPTITVSELNSRPGGRDIHFRRNGDSVFLESVSTFELARFMVSAVAEMRGIWAGSVTVGELRSLADLEKRAEEIARLADRAQVVIDLATTEILRGIDSSELRFDDLGTFRISGDRPIRVFRAQHESAKASVLGKYESHYSIASVGRDNDVRKVLSLMDSSRLVTVTGGLGVGKTHLLRLVWDEIADQARDSLFWVNLADIGQPDLVWSAFFRTLSVESANERTHEEAVIAAIGDREIFMFLDGAEGLAAELVPILTRLMSACGQLQVLVGSRRKLGMPDEQIFRLSGLSCVADPMSDLAAYPDAVRLFLDRCSLADPNFSIQRDDLETILGICVALDGNPLLIEMAAAKTPLFTPRQLLARLVDRLSLLSQPTEGGRKRKLGDLVEASFVYLSSEAQQLLAEISIFKGAFSVEAVATVSSQGGLAFVALEELLEWSWISVSTLGLPEKTFFLTDTVRLYAATRRGKNRELETRYREFILSLAQVATANLDGPDQAVWLERMTCYSFDIQNVIASGTQTSGDFNLSVELANSCMRFWFIRGHAPEVLELVAELAESRKAKSNPHYRRLLNVCGILFHAAGEYRRAARFAVKSLRLSRNARNKEGIAAALGTIGACASELELYTAPSFHARAARIFAELNEPNKEFSAWGNYIGSLRGANVWRITQAERQRVDWLREHIGDTWANAIVDANLAKLALFRGENDEIKTLAMRSIRAFISLRDFVNLESALLVLAMAYLDSDPMLSARLFGLANLSQREMPYQERTLEPVRAKLGHDLSERVSPHILKKLVQEAETSEILESIERWIG